MTWRFRLYPTAIQRARLDGHLRRCGQISHAALQERGDARRRARVSIGVQQQSAQRPARWTHAYVVSTIGGATLGVIRQDIEHQQDG
jgi:REP element-mobilizing transposase RayT